MRNIGLKGASILWTFDEFGTHLMNMFSWETITSCMDSTTREKVAQELPGVSGADFLRRYLEIAPFDLFVG